MQYELVLFDLDGTLMDTSGGVLRTIDYIIEKHQLPALDDAQKKSFIGPPVQKSFQIHYGCSEERAWELATAWRNAYKDIFLFEARAYDGIYDLLKFLRGRGIRTGVATNKREDYTKRLLEHFSFSPLFDCIIGSDFEGKRTKPDMIRQCMELCGVTDPRSCLMIGDTTGDLNAAAEAGTDFLGVTFGFGFKPNADNCGAKMADSCQEIQNIISELKNN